MTNKQGYYCFSRNKKLILANELGAVFEEEWHKHGIKFFVLPLHSYKLNGSVERVHRTHSVEFYEITEACFVTS